MFLRRTSKHGGARTCQSVPYLGREPSFWPAWFYTTWGRCAMSIKKFDTVRTLAFAWTTCHIGAMQKSSPPPSKRTHQALNQNSEHQRLSRYSHISNYNAWYSMQGWIRLPFRVPVWTPKAQPAPYSAIKKMVSLSSFIYIYIYLYI